MNRERILNNKTVKKQIEYIDNYIQNHHLEAKQLRTLNIAKTLFANGEWPLTGGTMYEASKIIEMYDAMNDVSVSEYIVDENSWFREGNNAYRFWLMILNQARYFTNLFTIDNEDTLDSSIIRNNQLMLCTLCMYGYVGWYFPNLGDVYTNNNKELSFKSDYSEGVIVLLTDVKTDLNGNFLTGTGIPAGYATTFGKLEYTDKGDIDWKKYHKEKFNLNTTNTVIFRWNNNNLGMWLTMRSFIIRLLEYLDIGYTNSKLLVHKILGFTNNPAAASDEWKALVNPRRIMVPVGMENLKEGTNQPASTLFRNRYEPFEFSNANVDEIIKWINFYVDFNYTLMGRRFNTNEKTERNINSEVMYSQSNFDILEREHLRLLKASYKELKKLKNIDIQISQFSIKNDWKEQENSNGKGGDKNENIR